MHWEHAGPIMRWANGTAPCKHWISFFCVSRVAIMLTSLSLRVSTLFLFYDLA